MEEAWMLAMAGGGLIGLSATINLLVVGRVTGVSGIFFGALKPFSGDFLWRVKFVVGLALGGALAALWLEEAFVNTTNRSLPLLLSAGFLVGFGTKLGSGCTSGHGVCGISRLSRRSLIATVSFMAAGIATVAVMSGIQGGTQ